MNLSYKGLIQNNTNIKYKDFCNKQPIKNKTMIKRMQI